MSIGIKNKVVLFLLGYSEHPETKQEFDVAEKEALQKSVPLKYWWRNHLRDEAVKYESELTQAQQTIEEQKEEIQTLKQQLGERCSSSANLLNLDTLEENKDFEGFIRAFWRRIAPYRHKYGKEIPFDERGKLPVEFTANMLTAFTIFKR